LGSNRRRRHISEEAGVIPARSRHCDHRSSSFGKIDGSQELLSSSPARGEDPRKKCAVILFLPRSDIDPLSARAVPRSCRIATPVPHLHWTTFLPSLRGRASRSCGSWVEAVPAMAARTPLWSPPVPASARSPRAPAQPSLAKGATPDATRTAGTGS